MALTKVKANMFQGNVIDIKERGGGGGGSDDSTIIQAAIDELYAAGGGTVYFPTGTYNLQNQLIPKSNVHYKGEGKNSSLKVNATSGITYIFNSAAFGAVDNIVWDGVGFDGSLNYPADSTVYAPDIVGKNRAIRLAGYTITNVTVRNCFFNSLNNGSFEVNDETGSTNISVINNHFYKGAYLGKVIRFRTPSGSAPADPDDRPSNIIVTGNRIEICGPQYHYDPSKSDWTASCDGIDFNDVRDVTCSDNVLTDIGSTGIRVENTLRASISNNKLINIGSNGISFYQNCFTCTCIGNTVFGYHRTPLAFAMRNYGGTFVVAREFPDASDAPLPADPTASSWFDTWPYSVENIDTSKVIAYSNTDYYTGSNLDGILPYRGGMGIAVVAASTRVSVIGNNVIANTSTDASGDDNYAHEWGYSVVHSSNSAASVAGAGANCIFIGNASVDQSAYRFYHPENGDPINGNGALGMGHYIGNVDDNSSIFVGSTGSTGGNLRIGSDGNQFMRAGINVSQYLRIKDGITAPGANTGSANIYVDTADGDLKVVFADGTVKTIVTDT
jgi:hypothetical protein